MDTRAAQLVAELQAVGLDAVDAHRAAFTALAASKGWSAARIGRTLDITRARVSQRIEKLHDYCYRQDVPTLCAIMDVAKTVPPLRTAYDEAVAFEKDDWLDLDFAAGLIDTVA